MKGKTDMNNVIINMIKSWTPGLSAETVYYNAHSMCDLYVECIKDNIDMSDATQYAESQKENGYAIILLTFIERGLNTGAAQ